MRLSEPVEVLAGAFAGQGIGAGDVGRFLVWVTLGNIVGGVVFVAFLSMASPGPRCATATARLDR